jgi:excisionase family DNA binding protein
MISLTNNIEPNKNYISVVGMKTILQDLNISYSTLYRWCQKGMPYYKVSGSKKLTFNREAVQKWLEEQTQKLTNIG